MEFRWSLRRGIDQGHINAATAQFLALLAEFDHKEGWAQHGVASCAHWLNWQCGISSGAAREKVRRARALESLPKIREAFSEGRLSYSKVRAVTRVATAVGDFQSKVVNGCMAIWPYEDSH